MIYNYEVWEPSFPQKYKLVDQLISNFLISESKFEANRSCDIYKYDQTITNKQAEILFYGIIKNITIT